MERISLKESRRNSVKWGRKVRARQHRASRFCAQGKPMFGSTRVHYEVSADGQAMSYGGIAAVHRLVTKLGLVKLIDARLQLLKVHLPYNESDHVLNLTYNLMCGGTRLEDIERLRSDLAYMNALNADLIPDPTTTGDFTRRFTEADVIELMDCINAVRAKLWRTRAARDLAGVAYIDVDGTSAPTYQQKKGRMDISYKGVWGYTPLIVSLANTKEVLYVVNRPGNASSHQGAAPWIDAALALVKPHAGRVCLRGDTDFLLTGHFDHWAKDVDFIFGMDAIRPWFHRSWISIKDPRFLEKAGPVLDLYHGYFEGACLGPKDYVLSADEKSQLQILERMFPCSPPGPGKPIHCESDYKRHGTVGYLAALDIRSGRVFGRVDQTTGIEPFQALVDLVMKQEPYASDERVFWILDNGPSHHPSTSSARLKKAYPNLIAIHLPIHASWLNQIEIYFSILQRKALTPNDLATRNQMEDHILGFQRRYNQTLRPFNWRFTRSNLEEGLRDLKIAA